MEENNVLDDLREEQPQSATQYRRALRFLFYVVGIASLVGIRIWFLIQNVSADNLDFRLKEAGQLYFFGLAGVWLFSGLGLVAILRARKERPTDLLYVGVFIAHLAAFVISCINLLKHYVQ